jgi:hypothetical protein
MILPAWNCIYQSQYVLLVKPSSITYLVVRVIRRLMPNIQILMRQIQRPGAILLDTPMQRLNALPTFPITRILQELQTRAAEPILFLKDRLIGQRDFERGVSSAVEARGFVGELEDVAPLDVVAFDVVRVVDCVCGVRVEESGGGGDGEGDAAVEDDFAFWVGAGGEVGSGESGGGG